MKKIVLFIAVLLFMTVPVMAVSDIEITCDNSVVGDVNWITVSYNVTGSPPGPNRIRAFGLDINVPDDGNIVGVTVLDPNYRIFPGQIVISDDGEVEDYNRPYDPCDLNDANVAVELGSLYTTDSNYASDPNWGYNKIPGLSGNLLKFAVKKACSYKIDVNSRRGGIVMEDPCEEPTVDTPLYYGTIPGCQPPQTFDFGDALDTYQTLLASNGPRHPAIGPMLGANRDTEGNGQPSPNCDLDDNTGVPDDEDGITLLTATPGVNGGSVTVTASAACLLNAWADFDASHNFVAGEQIFNNQPLAAGPNPLTFNVPVGAVRDVPLVTRWRVNEAGNLTWEGAAPDNGEVEDYNELIVECPPPPGLPSDPIPAAGAKCVALAQVLSWTPGANTATQDVYFGLTNPPPLVASDVPVGTTTYDPPGDMNVYTLYYWRIDEKNVCETTTGTVWCFATGAKAGKACCNDETTDCVGNVDGNTRVNNSDIGSLVSFITGLTNNRCNTAAGSTTCPPCNDVDGSGRVDNTDIGELVSRITNFTNNRHNCPYPSCSNP